MFVAGCLSAVLLTWLWEFMTATPHDRFVEDLDQYRATQENERLLDEFVSQSMPERGRREIWLRMGWIWKETRALVLRSRSLAGFVSLGLFALLYIFFWFKTLVWANARDLRLLLGGRGALLYVLQERKH